MAWDTDLPPQKEYKLFRILKDKGLIDYNRAEQIRLTPQGKQIAKQIAKELGVGKVTLLFILLLVIWYEHLEDMYMLWRDTDKLIKVINEVTKN